MNSHYQKYKESIKATSYKWLHEHQEVRILNTCKQSAKKRGLEFSLGFSDIKIPTICPYLGIPITNIFNQGRVFSNASIDRIDNTKVYTPDNIEIISDLANRMKQDATKEQLIAFARGILSIHAPGEQ